MRNFSSSNQAEPLSSRLPLFPSNRAFLVQFSRDTSDEPKPYIGRIEHVVSGRSAQFATREDLIDFIDQILGGQQL